MLRLKITEEKLIQLKGINNFRDFGDYRTKNGMMVKKGMLYRSGNLTKASDNDLKIFSSIGIKVVCDLRAHKERIKRPDRFPPNSNIKYIHIPIKSKRNNDSGFILNLLSLIFGEARKLDFNELFKEIYQEFVTDFSPEFSKIIKLVADSNNLPILIHCTGGKDRTGFACALVQLILGLPLELVMQDYLLTTEYLKEFKNEILNRYRFLSIFGISRKRFLPFFEARKEYLEEAFDQIKKDYGTVEDYIKKGLGINDKLYQKLHSTLIVNISN